MEPAEIKSLIERCLACADGAQLAPDDAAALRTLATERPAFVLPQMLLLRHGALDSAEAEAAEQRIALLCPSRSTLAFARYGDDWAHFYPEAAEPEAKRTVDVIDTFLNTYGNCTPEEEKLLERMIFNPAPDYAEVLAREEQANLPAEDEAPADSQDALINAFILTRHPATHSPSLMPEEEPEQTTDGDGEKAREETARTPIPRPEHADDSLLSESLAKIFIKQGRYERAHEIISGLNLKFPKKSAYFADQLRFLQKLIINRRHTADSTAPGAHDN